MFISNMGNDRQLLVHREGIQGHIPRHLNKCMLHSEHNQRNSTSKFIAPTLVPLCDDIV